MKNALKTYNDPVDTFISNLFDFGDNFGRIFEDLPRSLDYPYWKTTKAGHVNLFNDEKSYKVEVSAPGFAKDELNIEMKDNVLFITGEKSQENVDENKNYTRKEFYRNSFQRAFRVPDNITGDIDAKFENGILTIGLAKKEIPPKPEPKKIEIK